MTKSLSSFVSIVLLSLLFVTGRTFAFYNSATLFGTTARSSLYSRHYQQAQGSRTNGNTLSRIRMVTITEERTETDRSTRYDNDIDDDFDEDDYDDLEYLMDSKESRAWEEPFHILLLGQTFDKPKVTISYVTGSLEYVLSMPRTEATELAKFAKSEGLSCLGTWPREECLSLGRQLQMRDIVCRVVPFCEGGQRGWQAKDSSSSSSNNAGAGKSNQPV